MSRTFKPVGPRIKIRVLDVEEEKTASGLITGVKQTTKEDMELGEVIEVGHLAYKDLSDEKPWVKVGDTVLFQRYAGKPVPQEGDLFRFLKDIDVIAVCES